MILNLSSRKTMLVMGEEYVYAYSATKSSVSFIGKVEYASEECVEILSDMLVHSGRKAPVVILYDLLEQHYRREKAPKLGAMDRQKYIDRKLAFTFPNNPMSAALKVNAPKGKQTESQSYLFCSVPNNQALVKVARAIEASGVHTGPLALLPVESSDLVQELLKKDTIDFDPDPSSWNVIIGAHKSGGLRQVISQNGTLALTRMTLLSSTDVGGSQSEYGEEAAAEFKSTLSYLSRLGYSDRDNINVIFVCNDDRAAQSFRAHTDQNITVVTKTTQEALGLLGMSTDEIEDFSVDMLHAAWVAKRSKIILPIKSAMISSVATARVAVMAVTILLFLSLLGGVGYNIYILTMKIGVDGNIRQEKNTLSNLDRDLSEVEGRLNAFGVDERVVRRTIEAFEVLESKDVDILPVYYSIKSAYPEGMAADKIEFDRIDSGGSSAGGGSSYYQAPVIPGQPAPSDVIYELTLDITFAENIDPETGVLLTNEFQQNLMNVFPGYTVEILKQVADLSRETNYSETVNSAGQVSSGGGFESQIKISGEPLK